MDNEKKIALVIASNITRLLDSHHITRKELAERIGVSLAAVGFWCTGAKIPRMDKVDKMCNIFGCERSDILMDNSPSTPPSPAVHLTTDRMALLRDYDKLNDEGKAKVREYAADLADNGRYIKNTEPSIEARSA